MKIVGNGLHPHFPPLNLLAFLFGLGLAMLPAQPASSQSNKVDQSEPTDLWTRKTGDDWPGFLGIHRDGKSAESGILTDWGDAKLKVVWKQELGEGYGMGSVANGRFYHFDRHQGQARVRCFHAESGVKLWQFEYPSLYRDLYGYDSGPRASPVVDGNRVYLYGVEGMLHCLSADHGRELWKLDTAETFGVIQNFFGVASTPVIADDLLLVMVGGSPPESKTVAPAALDRVLPNGSGIVALDKMTGEIKYRIADDLASYSSIQLTRRNRQSVALVWLRGSLIGFETQTGKTILEFPYRSPKLESVNASTPVVVDDHVFISECYGIGGTLLKVSDSGCEVVWTDRGKRDKSLEAHWNTPIVIDDHLYGCSGRHLSGAELRCVNWNSGAIKWKKAGFSRSSLTYIDGHFILLDEEGQLGLLAANPARFEMVTRYEGEIKFKSPCWAAPIVSNGLMYVRGKVQLVCFELIPAIPR